MTHVGRGEHGQTLHDKSKINVRLSMFSNPLARVWKIQHFLNDGQ